MAIAFAVFFFGIAHMVTSAFQAYEPPSDPAYHEKGLDIQKRNDEFNRATERGWSASIPIFETESVATGKVRLTFTLIQANAVAANNDEVNRPAVKIAIYRPATMIDSKEYIFNQSSLKKVSVGQYQFSEEIEIPNYESKKIEIAIEIRPEPDSAIYRSKRFELR